MNTNNNEYIVIGLDFGTSCSKVVVQAPFIVGGGKCWAVYFGVNGHQSNRYLLPSRIVVGEDGVGSLLQPQSVGSHFHVGKEYLLEEPQRLIDPIKGTYEPQKAICLAVLYVALTLRVVRKWFQDNHGTEFKGKKIVWEFNLGIPSKGFDDKELRSVFHKIAIAAWGLSEKAGSLTMDNAREYLENDDGKELGPDINPEDINVLPEVIAEFMGYSLSSERQEGLHIIADVGANTFDLCAFELHKRDGVLRYPFLSAIVEKMGAFRLHENRLSLTENWFQGLLRKNGKIDDQVVSIPSDLKSYLSFINNESELVSLSEQDDKYLDKCKLMFTQTIHWMLRRSPNSRMWEIGIPCFFCGGGAQLDFYQKALLKANGWIRSHTQRKPLQSKLIPKPKNLIARNLSENEYQRLGVAYGLSFRARNFGEFTSSCNISPLLPEGPTSYDMIEYISKEYM